LVIDQPADGNVAEIAAAVEQPNGKIRTDRNDVIVREVMAFLEVIERRGPPSHAMALFGKHPA
jgi:hypothetical protein